jgi:hypothetical protein
VTEKYNIRFIEYNDRGDKTLVDAWVPMSSTLPEFYAWQGRVWIRTPTSPKGTFWYQPALRVLERRQEA